MNKLIFPATLLSFLLFLSCDNPSSSGDQNTNTTTVLEGTWTGLETGGNGKAIKWVVSNSNMSEYENDTLTYKGTFIIDESVNPKQIDVTITDCSYTSYIGKVALGIFKVESNSLTFCANEPGNSSRPSSFTKSGNSRLFVFSKN
jgi:uncharacterized protein (TIGR03067 family)